MRIRKGKKVMYREAKTFTHLAAAEKWGKSREVALEEPHALMRAGQGTPSLAELAPTPAQLAKGYIEFFEPDIYVQAKPDLSIGREIPDAEIEFRGGGSRPAPAGR